jgi:hypothetical protein
MHSPRFKGDFLGRLLLLLLVAFGLTVVLQARALRADAVPASCAERPRGQVRNLVVRSTGFEPHGVQSCLRNLRSESSGSAT